MFPEAAATSLGPDRKNAPLGYPDKVPEKAHWVE
jgi:hypothetical protein